MLGGLGAAVPPNTLILINGKERTQNVCDFSLAVRDDCMAG